MDPKRGSGKRLIDIGRRRNTTRGETYPRAKKAKTPPKANQPAPQQINKYRIENCKIKVSLFPEPAQNRRMTAWEFEQELQEARIWGRRPRSFIFDKLSILNASCF